MKKFLLLGCLVVFFTHVLYAQTDPNIVFTPAANANVDASFTVTYESGSGTNNVDDWETKISVISVGGNALPASAYSVDTGANSITFNPANSESLQKAVVNLQFTIEAENYDNAVFTQTINPGAPSKMEITTQPVGPASNGGALETQPILQLKDQYDNECDNNSTLQVTAEVSTNGGWTIGGTVTVTANSGVVTFTDLTAYANIQTANAKIDFSASGIPTVTSNSFTINMTDAPTVNAENNATVDDDVVLTYNNNDTWRDKIREIQVDGTKLDESNYDKTVSGQISLRTENISTLHVPGTYSITILANGYKDVTVSQNLSHGEPAKIEITQQPDSPLTDGGELTVQPIVKLSDKYNNVCNERNFTVEAAANSSDWTIGGTTSVNTDNNGNAAYSNLTASSVGGTSNARIKFTYSSLTIESESFAVGLAAPSDLTAAANATVDNDFDLTFTDNTDWRTNISEITVDGTLINSGDYITTSAGKITFKIANITAMHNPGDFNIEITAKGFKKASITQTIAHGAVVKLEITQQPEAPATNGGELATQPQLELKDKYDNICTSNTNEVTASAKDNKWTIGGTTTINAASGVIEYTNLTASASEAVSNAQILFRTSSLEVTSDAFNLSINDAPALTADNTDNTVDNEITITFTDDADWRSKINKVTIDDNIVDASQYTLEVGQIKFNPSNIQALQKVGDVTIKIEAEGYSDANVTQQMLHGEPNKLVVLTQPESPVNNGGELATQPKIQFQDQYDNVCTSVTENVTASEDDDSKWTLGGTKQVAATNGEVTYSDLTATLKTSSGVTAKIKFASSTLNTESATFDLSLSTPPTLTAADNATVDNSFSISYSSGDDNWKDKVTEITIDGETVTYAFENYNKRITFNPAENPVLQTAKENAQIVVKADGYKDATVNQTIKHGEAKGLKMVVQPTAPAQNGQALQQQPVVGVKDQYGNTCTSLNSNNIKAEAVGADWTLSGTVSVNIQNGKASYTDLVATADKSTTAQIKFIYNAVTPEFEVTSNEFNLELAATPTLSSGYGEKTVDSTFEITYSGSNADDWENKINDIYIGTERLSSSAYNIVKGDNKITFDPSKSELLQKAETINIIIKATTYNDASIDVTLKHGEFAKLTIVKQPEAPETNGGELKVQPEVAFQDQYGNTCTSTYGLGQVTAKANNDSWTLGGTLTVSPSSGIAVYTDLTATTSEDLTNASIIFTVDDKSVESNSLEFKLDTPPTLTAASGATVDEHFEVNYEETEFTNSWESAANKTVTFEGETLPEDAYAFNTSNNKIVFKPEQSEILQKAVTNAEIVIKVPNFKSASVTQTVAHGAATTILIKTQPVAPVYNGGELEVQPEVYVEDQYKNKCTGDNDTEITAAANNAEWTLGGTVTAKVTNGALAYTDLTASSDKALKGIFIKFSANGVTGAESAKFNLGTNIAPDLTAAANATVDAPFEITFTDKDEWQSKITQITYDDVVIDASAYDITQANKIVFDPAKSAALQNSKTADIVVSASAFDDAKVEQTINNGVAKKMYVKIQPAAPASNGAVLETQPKIGLRDQYDNECSTDNTTSVTVARGDENEWTLGGTLTVTANKGVATFTDLTASSNVEVEEAFLKFTADNMVAVTSDKFIIPLNSKPELYAAKEATVDNPFAITFTDNANWREKITEVKFGDTVLDNTVYKTEKGKITFDPAKSELLQKPSTTIITISADGYAPAKVEQTIAHGIIAKMKIRIQPVGPDSNGNPLSTQPEINLLDQYENLCDSDNSTEVNATVGSGTWEIAGTTKATAVNGTVVFDNIIAQSTKKVTDATIMFKCEGLEDVESEIFTIPAPEDGIVVSADENATVDNPFTLTFTENAEWRTAVDSIYCDGEKLNASALDNTQEGKLIIDPAKDKKLQSAGEKKLQIYATGYNLSEVTQKIKHGVANKMEVVIQPKSPERNGGELSVQPALQILDKYNNKCSTENTITITVAKGDSNSWTLGGTLTKKTVDGSVNFSDLTASSETAITGVFITFSSEGLSNVNSDTFDIPGLETPPVLTASSDARVDKVFSITFPENKIWRTEISEIRFGKDVLPQKAYDITEEGKITFDPDKTDILHKAAEKYIVISSKSFTKDSVLQDLMHGTAKTITITQQPKEPNQNGNLLTQQPIVKLFDKYNNACNRENAVTVTASATGGSWYLEGTVSITVTNGVAEFTDLTAGSESAIDDATITFSGEGLTKVESDPFQIPAPTAAPNLLAASNATVDNPFTITFAENAQWQSNIKSISFDGKKLPDTAYDSSNQGEITFDPSKSTILQKAKTADIIVVSKGFGNAKVSQVLEHGEVAKLKITKQPTPPAYSGGEFEQQPYVEVVDQYDNICKNNSDFEVTVAKGDDGEWTLGGEKTVVAVNGLAEFIKLTASCEKSVEGAFLTFTGKDVPTVNSDKFDIPAFKEAPKLTAQSDATVDNDIVITFEDKTNEWRKRVVKLLYGGEEVKNSHYSVNENNIVLQVVKEPLFQKSGTFKVEVLATGYNSTSVDQTVKHGAIDSMILDKQPLAPLTNGALLRQQPVLSFVDQYKNVCDSESTKTITAKKYDDGVWTLDGTKEVEADKGVVTFTDLSAYSTAPITGAKIAFTSDGLYTVVSEPFDIPDITTPPELTAAENATVDNPFDITFSENKFWRDKIKSIRVNGETLTAKSFDKTLPGKIRFIPAESKVLQKSGELEVIIEATGFDNNLVKQQLNNGVADSLIIIKQPKAPAVNGDVLAAQPELKLVDQYLNTCVTNSVDTVEVSKADAGDWTLGGTLKVVADKGIIAYTDLTATSELAVRGAKLQFIHSKGKVESEPFDLPIPVIKLIADDNATVDNPFTVTFTDNSAWREAITEIKFAGDSIKSEAYTIEPGKITLDPAKDTILHKAQKAKLVVVSKGFSNSEVEQDLKHGVADSMLIVKQPTGPKKNGEKLVDQPELSIVDKYENVCTSNNSIEVTAEKYGDGTDKDNSEDWTLGGTVTVKAVDGIVTYKDLTAASEDLVKGAKLQFNSYGLPSVVSEGFDIVRPKAPVLIPDENATVDEPFTITFEENKAWREAITDIKYGIISIKGNFDISMPGKIIIDPAKATVFQKAGQNTITVISGEYNDTQCTQVIVHGKARYIIVKKQPTQPLENGGALVKQPQLLLQDQYRNNCDTDNDTPITVRKADSGDWKLGGMITKIAKDGIVTYVNLTATSSMAVSNARLEFFGDNVVSTESETFNIPEPKSDRAGTALANPERVCAGESSNITLSGFDGKIQWQIYNNDTGEYEDISGETASVHVTKPIVKNERYRAKVTKEKFAPQFSNIVTVSPVNPVVADFSFEVKFNTVSFTNLSENATSLEWDFGDGQLSSDVNPVHSYILNDMNGEGFQVTLTASNGACPNSKKTKEVFIVTDVDDLVAEKGVVVYPNPSNGEFFMELLESQEDGIMRIFDATGKVVHTAAIEKHFGAKRMHFDLKSLSRGLYVITIQYPTKVVRTKLLIK